MRERRPVFMGPHYSRTHTKDEIDDALEVGDIVTAIVNGAAPPATPRLTVQQRADAIEMARGIAATNAARRPPSAAVSAPLQTTIPIGAPPVPSSTMPAADPARVDAIVQSWQAVGRQNLARHLALKTNLPVDQALAHLVAAAQDDFNRGRAAALAIRGKGADGKAPLRIVGGGARTAIDRDQFEAGRSAALALLGRT